jgi:hypothetical protein
MNLRKALAVSQLERFSRRAGGDGLGALWRVTTNAIYRALPMMGQGNLEAIADDVREGAIKVD